MDKKEIEKEIKKAKVLDARSANDMGISNQRLKMLEKEGVIERVDHGLYIHPDHPQDMLYIYQQRRKFIYSHDTALYLHNLTDRDPLSYSVSVYTGYNSKKLKELGFSVFFVKKELLDRGVTIVQTPYGNSVQVYSVERTLCDILRSRNRLDKQLIIDAFKVYSQKKQKNLHELMKFAKLFKVEKLVKGYLEVLL